METNLFLICGASKYLNLVRILSSKPSTNRNGNANAEKGANGNAADPEALAAQESSKRRGKRRKNKDVSKHTFFVSNSQMRLKLFAKNEVRRIFDGRKLVKYSHVNLATNATVDPRA